MPPDSSPRFTCKVNLSNTKNPTLFFILASRLDRGMQRVNWLPPRTLVARVFLKIIFRGCPIINSLSNGAMLYYLCPNKDILIELYGLPYSSRKPIVYKPPASI